MTPNDIALNNLSVLRTKAQLAAIARKQAAFRIAKVAFAAAILALLLWGVR